MTQSFPLKFTDHLEQSNADRYCQSDVVFWLQNRPYVSHREHNHAVRPFSQLTEIDRNFSVAE